MLSDRNSKWYLIAAESWLTVAQAYEAVAKKALEEAKAKVFGKKPSTLTNEGSGEDEDLEATASNADSKATAAAYFAIFEAQLAIKAARQAKSSSDRSVETIAEEIGNAAIKAERSAHESAEGFYVEFEDSHFTTYLKRLFKGKNVFREDGKMNFYALEVRKTKSIDVEGKSIKSLKGIEYFTVLKELNCSQNELGSLNLRNNHKLLELRRSDNKISKLNLSEESILNTLICHDNQIHSLDLSKNTYMTHLEYYRNDMAYLDATGFRNAFEDTAEKRRLFDIFWSECKADMDCNRNKQSGELKTLKIREFLKDYTEIK